MNYEMTVTKENHSSEILSLRDQAKNQLLQIRTVEDGITYLNKLKTLDAWIRAEKKDAELQNIVAEQKLRTQRILGELIPEARRKGLLKDKVNNLIQNSEVDDNDLGKTLEEVGITKDQSSVFQAIAAIPAEKFDAFLQEKKEAHKKSGEELTTAGALRFAKSLLHQSNESDQPGTVFPEYSIEDEIQEMARDINTRFNTEQKALLISLIK